MIAGDPPPAPPEPPIVVTASRIEAAPPGAVSSLDRAEIDRSQPSSLLDVLGELAGVRAFSTGGAGGRSFLSIRGGEPNFTLVLIEGIRVNDPTNSRGGGFDFFVLDPALVERVDVVRGAGSAIHGSDALSGVVSVALRSPEAGHRGAELRGEAGTGGDTGFGASLENGWRGGGVLAAASRYDSGDLTEGSRIRREQGLAQLRQRAGGFDVRVTGLYGHATRSAFPEDSGGPRLAVIREEEHGDSELAAAGISIRHDSAAAVRPNLSITWSHQQDRSDTPAIAPGALNGTPALSADSRFSRAEVVADVGLGRGPALLTVGAAWLRESGTSDGTIQFGFRLPVRFALTRTTRSGFAEATLRPASGLSVELAGRYDDVEEGSGRFTGRAGAAWRPVHAGPTLFARWGQGYKLPSFYALGHPLIGDPALRPERSTSAEAGLEQRIGQDLLRLTVYRNRFRDLIDFDPALFRLVNRARVAASGAELEGTWHARPTLQVVGALTWLRLQSEAPLRGRPQWQGFIRTTWQATRALELNAAVRFNGSYFDSSIPTGLLRETGHAELELGLRLRLTSRLGFALSARNLTGARYEDAVGFPAPRTQLRGSVLVDVF